MASEKEKCCGNYAWNDDRLCDLYGIIVDDDETCARYKSSLDDKEE